MPVFPSPEVHAANPPDTWIVQKHGRRYELATSAGEPLDYSFERKSDAEQARTTGRAAKLYEQETRWYAGESIPNWRPYSEVKAEQEKTEARRLRAMHEATLANP